MQGRAPAVRASLFVAIYVLIAAAAFAALALTVKSAPYFPIDLAITRARCSRFAAPASTCL